MKRRFVYIVTSDQQGVWFVFSSEAKAKKEVERCMKEELEKNEYNQDLSWSYQKTRVA